MKKLIFSILLFFTISTNAQKDDKICGTVEKYKQTHAWRDLPGCISDFREEGEESQTTAGLLAYAKKQFKNFYDRWEAYQFYGEDPIATLVTACNFYKDVSAKDKWESDPALLAAAPLFEEHAKKVEEEYDLFYTKWREVIAGLTDIYIQAEAGIPATEQRFAEIKSGKGEPIRQLIDGPSMFWLSIQNAKQLLEKARADKMPDALIIPGIDANSSTTVGKIRDELIKKWETFSIAADKQERELYEAGIAPFMKLMSGDKASEFRKRYGLTFYGPGGKKLKTPEDYANARSWYTSGSALCTICPRWAVEGIHFNGNKVVNKTREEGQGTFPPDSIFK